MENKSNLLLLGLIVMMGVFSLVIIFKGDFKDRPMIDKKSQTIAKQEKPASKTSPQLTWKMAPPVEPQREPAVVQTAEPEPTRTVIDRREKWSGYTKLEKDEFGRDVVAEDVLVVFKMGTASQEAEKIAQSYQLKLEYFDSTTGVAKFKLTEASGYSRADLQSLLPKQNTSIQSAEPNVRMKWLNLPAEIVPGGAWYLRNNAQVKNNLLYLQWLNKFGIQKWDGGTQLPTNGVDLSWGKWTDAYNPYDDATLSCSLADGAPVIAVLDSGIDIDHPEFLNRIDFTKSAHASCTVNRVAHTSVSTYFDYEAHKGCFNDPQTYLNLLSDLKKQSDSGNATPREKMAHGHVMQGIISAANNGNFQVGLCPRGKSTQIMIGKFEKDSGGTVGHMLYADDTYYGTKMALEKGAKVLSMSFGSDSGTSCEGYPVDCWHLQTIRMARASGALIVMAAGNDIVDIDTAHHSPASASAERDNANNQFSHLITVGGFDGEGKPFVITSGGSNFGAESVSLFAPGKRITGLKLSQNYLTTKTDKYGPYLGTLLDIRTPTDNNISLISGTSNATPQVAAVAGMVYTILHNKFGADCENRKLTHPNEVCDFAKATVDIIEETSTHHPNRANQNNATNPGKNLCQSYIDENGKQLSKYGCIDAEAAIKKAKDIATLGFSDATAQGSNLAFLDTSLLPASGIPTQGGGGGGGAGVAAGGGGASSGGGGGGGGCGAITTDQDSSGGPTSMMLLLVYMIPLAIIYRRKLFETVRIKRK